MLVENALASSIERSEMSFRVTESTAASGGGRETEEGKVTSGQEGLQPVAVRDDNFSGHLPEESLQLKKHKNNCSTESCRAKILRLVTLAQNDILPL